MIHVLTKLTELGNITFPKAQKAWRTPHKANTARRQQGTVSRDQHRGAACLGRGHGKQGEKPLPELQSLQFTIKEQRTAEDKGKAASTYCSSYTCACWQESVSP